MKPLLLVLSLAAVSCSAASETTIQDRGASSQNSGIPAYPEWFLHPDRWPEVLSTGYAPVSFFEDEAIARAFADAKEAVRAQRGLRLSYTTFWEQLPDDSFRKTGREIHIDTLGAEKDDLLLLTGSSAGRMTVAAAGTEEIPSLSSVPRTPGPQPVWVRQTPDSESGMYAVGFHTVYYNEQESWKRAELQALLSLARSYNTEHRRLERTLNGASEALTLQTSRVTIASFRVVERWRDARTSYVLIHAHIRE